MAHAGWGPWGFWWIVPLLFWVLLLFAVVRFAFWGWRRGHRWAYGGPGGGAADAEAVLQRRFAAGEIDEAEYRRVRDVLRKE
jgi:putative membrane protein